MPTKTRKAPARKRPPTKRPPAKRPPAKRRARGQDARRQDVVRDVWAWSLLILAALSGLSVWTVDAAGVLGIYLELVWRGLFGVFGLTAPLALAAGGVVLLRDPRPGNRRVAAGSVLTALGVAGLWHLAAGAPGWDAPVAELQEAAGYVGAFVARPLAVLAGPWGAVVLLAPIAVLGVLVVTATPPRAVLRRLAGACRAVADRVGEWRSRRALRADEEVVVPADGAEGEDPEATVVVDDDDHTVVLDDDDPTGEVDLSDTQLLPRGVDLHEDEQQEPHGREGATPLAPPDPTWAGYQLPSLDLLRAGRAAPGNKRTLDQMTRALEYTLHQFGVDARVARVSRGPTVTRFEVELGPGVKVSAVTKLGDDISYALATAEIRIVAPIPGKSAIGIEVPNRDRDLITLGDVLRSPEAAAQRHPLTAGLGVDIAGNAVLVNLATMPHLLIAGATGSGKSVTMNGIVTSVIMRASPAHVRMILVDPKRVELNHYEGTPHLLTPVVTDAKRATEALAWTVKEMEDRYERLALLGYRNVDSYNAAVRDGVVREAPALSRRPEQTAEPGWQPLPYILFVIDELADLMMVAPRDVESHIVRIAQMARAVGIHLIVATQRPSVDVVTGLIKANIPSRVALAMATQADSRTILDQGGAEKLVGHGDMLLMPANASKPHRIQGCYVDEGEIETIVAACKSQREADYTPGVVREGEEAFRADVTADDATDEDLTRAAMDLVVRSGLGSTSMLQRKLKVGFARAGRLMDELEQMGVVGPSEGPKARHVLMSVDELEERLGKKD